MLRGIAVALLLLGGALWAAPALLVPRIASGLASRAGVELEFDGVRPALPWGMTSQRVLARRGDGSADLGELSAQLSGGELRVESRVGEGTLLLKTRGLTALGSLRAESLSLANFAPLLLGEVALRGIADGAYRSEAGDSFEATVRRGSVSLHDPFEMEIPFTQLVVTAAREDDGAWRVDFADLQGPQLSGNASGRIDASGRLDLHLVITHLEDPALSAFLLADLPTEPLPIELELGGTLAQPLVTSLDAPAQ